MLRYLSYEKLCDATFTVFLVSWLITRNICFTFIVKSTYSDSPILSPFQWVPEEGRYYSKTSWTMFMCLLSALQVIKYSSYIGDYVNRSFLE